jgi:divalent metal cation (Fe/Co/Zn/Cd) transporter
MVGTDWGVGQVLFTIVWIALFFIWIMLLLNVFQDIFRSHDIGGPVKALWILLIILFPYVGVFLYIVIRGHKMTEHQLVAAKQTRAAFDDYVRQAAGVSPADEIAKLASLREQGVIDDEEFRQLKAKIVVG